MVGSLVPTPAFPINTGFGQRADKLGRYPDVIEPAAPVRGRPVACPITPPSEQTLLPRHKVPDRVDKPARALQKREAFDLDRRVADNSQKLLVRPDIGFQRSNVQIPHHNRRSAVLTLCREPCRQLVEKPEFVSKLWIVFRV